MAGDSMLDLYHRTTPEAARAILREDHFVTRENRPEAYCSTRVDGQGEDTAWPWSTCALGRA